MKEILECVDRALDSFGSSVRVAIYYMLAAESGVKPTEVLSNPEAFTHSLETIFGPGSWIIEQHIIGELRSKFNVTSKILPDAIRQAEKELLGQLQIA